MSLYRPIGSRRRRIRACGSGLPGVEELAWAPTLPAMPATITVRVVLCGPAHARAGRDLIEVALPAERTEPAAALAAIGRTCPALLPLLPKSRLALGDAFLAGAFTPAAGDELVLVPPVSGG